MKFTDDHGIKCNEMRKLRYCSDGYIHVSKQSFEKEMRYRRDRIKEGVEYEFPKWEELEIYEEIP
jgi:hypothetical protein